MLRRQFGQAAILLPAAASLAQGMFGQFQGTGREGDDEMRADLVIVGGGVGGCAAALAAARMGLNSIITEPTDWIGGQLTQQAVPPDENAWIESFGCTRSYRAYRNGIREFYGKHYPLTAAARGQKQLNPGGGSVSRLCHEPRVGLAVLHQMLAPHLTSRRVRILHCTNPVAADVAGDRVRSVTVERTTDGKKRTLFATYFLDASELGDLLPLTRTEYVSGAESARKTGEMHGLPEADAENVQSFTACFPMEHVAGGNFVGDPPADYPFWKDYVPKLTPAWSGKLLDWTATHPITLGPRKQEFDPERQARGWWTYRRIVDRNNLQPGSVAGSTTLVNWPQNDYWLGNIIDKPADVIAKHIRGAKQLSLSLFHWMQTEAPRPDGKAGWPGLRLRPDMVDTDDGLAKMIYIRESRRIVAEFTVLEQHVGLDMRRKPGQKDTEVRAENFADSVGVGHYRIDLHPSSAGNNYIDVGSLPFQIPLGSLLPVRMTNLLPACKNLGVTHVTNGCYRLHPVEWNIGEAAALLAAYCIANACEPKVVRADAKRLGDFQRLLVAQGVELAWPADLRRR